MDAIYCVVSGLNIIEILLLIYMIHLDYGVFCFLFLDLLLSYCPHKFLNFVGISIDIFFIGYLIWDFLEEGTEAVIFYYIFLWVLGVYLIIKNLLFYSFFLQIIKEVEEEL